MYRVYTVYPPLVTCKTELGRHVHSFMHFRRVFLGHVSWKRRKRNPFFAELGLAHVQVRQREAEDIFAHMSSQCRYIQDIEMSFHSFLGMPRIFSK